jgi:probable O-glycosylation ligase (exosortase A-associated)
VRDIVLALFIFGTIPFILSRPYIGLLVWSWIGYMNPHRLTYGFAYSFPWVYLIAVVTLVSLAFSKESRRIAKSSVSILLFLFLVWTAVTTLFAVEPASAWQKLDEFAKVLAMVFVTLMLANTRERLHWLVWVIVVSLGFYGLKAGLFTLTHGGSSHALGPPGSFISDNNAFAMALCMTLPLMRYLQLHSARKLVRIGLGVGILLTGIAVLGTYSRGGLIGLVVVAAALLLKGRRKFALIATLVLVGTVAYHFMPPQWTARMGTLKDAKQTDSGQTRIQSWEFSANLALHRPLVGGGFDAYENAGTWVRYAPEGATQRAVHSIYFRVLGEQGFVGLALFLAMLAASWRSCARVRKRTRDSPDARWAFDLASMLQVSLAAFMSAGAFLPMTYFDLSYQLMAMCVLLELCARSQSAAAAPTVERRARSLSERPTKGVARYGVGK